MTQPAAGSGGAVERIKREIAQGSHNSNGRQCVFLETADVRELIGKLEELRKAGRSVVNSQMVHCNETCDFPFCNVMALRKLLEGNEADE